jgi:hypothetical protein
MPSKKIHKTNLFKKMQSAMLSKKKILNMKPILRQGKKIMEYFWGKDDACVG